MKVGQRVQFRTSPNLQGEVVWADIHTGRNVVRWDDGFNDHGTLWTDRELVPLPGGPES